MTTPPRRHPYLSLPVWLTYAVLLAIAIPWYWPADEPRLLLGVPLWAVVSFGSSALVSIFTAWLLLRHWPEDDGGPDAEAPPGDGSRP